MRKVKIAQGEHYHIYNRGNRRQSLFLDDSDWSRFLFLILYMQSPAPVTNIGHRVKLYLKHKTFSLYDVLVEDICKRRYVDLINFCVMPNHFHLTVYEREKSGIARYMQRVLNAYTKYFNVKYKKEGHVFQGPFQAVRVTTNEQLLHLSAYIHRNPRDIREWRGKEGTFPFSSLPDYISENRWGELLVPKIILEQFKDRADYKKFVDTSSTKILEEKLDEAHRRED